MLIYHSDKRLGGIHFWRMALYFFHLHDCGTIIADEEGVELADAAGARLYAVSAARDVISGEARDGRICLGCHIEVEDRATGARFDVAFLDAVTVTGYPATM